MRASGESAVGKLDGASEKGLSQTSKDQIEADHKSQQDSEKDDANLGVLVALESSMGAHR